VLGRHELRLRNHRLRLPHAFYISARLLAAPVATTPRPSAKISQGISRTLADPPSSYPMRPAKGRLRRPRRAGAIRESCCLGRIGGDAAIEHLDLQPDAVSPFVLVHSRLSHRLNDEVNVSGHAVHV